jgi:hypothetical protein
LIEGIMKKCWIFIWILAMAGWMVPVMGQTAEKSSGKLELNMSKKEPEKVRTNETSQPTSIRMTKSPKSVATESTGNAGFAWISPAFTTVRTAESSYHLEATVNSDENIRFVNLFANGQFVKNIIPPVPTIKQMVIEEDMPLALGANQIKAEAVTVSGKKLESNLEIIYDISTAKYYALVIAVEEYDDPNINDLDHPVDDATKFINVINKQYNFDLENITFLKNPTKADIIGTLHNMRHVVTPEDNLLIYYAGHGWWDEEMETGYWLPRDAVPDNPVDWLPNTDLTNYLNVLKTKHTLLIADACFSGGIFKSRAAFNNEMAVEKLYKLNSRKAITSGALKEVPDRSYFVEYLIKRLEQNSKKYLPSEELYSSLKEAVMNNSPNVPQYGTIQNVGDEGGDFIFIRRN